MFFAELVLTNRFIATVHPQLCRQYSASFSFWLIFCLEIGINVVVGTIWLTLVGVGLDCARFW